MNNYQKQKERINNYLNINDNEKLDNFINELINKINLSLNYKNELIKHYYDAIEYYLEQDKNIDEIIFLLDYRNINDFYKNNNRRKYRLDLAANLYTINTNYDDMFVFRIAASLKEDIIPNILQIALDFTLKRFPTFSAILKKDFFWHYLESVNYPINIEEEKDLPCKSFDKKTRKRQSIRILYHKNKISLELFHFISDANGAMVFLKTLITEYLKLLGKNISIENGILDVNENVKEEELYDEYLMNENIEGINHLITKKSLQIDAKATTINPYQIIHYILDLNEIKEITRKYNTTITSYIISLLFLVFKKIINKEKGFLNIQVPINNRKYNNSKTLRNYVTILNINKNIEDIDDKKDLIKDITDKISIYNSEEEIKKQINDLKRYTKYATYLPLIIKRIIARIIFKYIVAKDMVIVFSNIGIINISKEIEDDIKYFDFIYKPIKPNPATISLVTYKDKIRLTIIKNCKEDILEKELLYQLREDGLSIIMDSNIIYDI